MTVWSLRFREFGKDLLFADDAGGFFRSDEAFLERYALDRLTVDDLAFLRSGGHAFEREGDLAHTAFAWRWSSRLATAGTISYLMLVPTLRCVLDCSYCQVSRAPEKASGFDWTEETLRNVLGFLDQLETDEVKIEFQGGEPTLRLDLLERVRTFCRSRFTRSEFVVCTNLQRTSSALWEFLEADDTFTSTSIDGDLATHDRQRTKSPDLARQFFTNVEEAAKRLGPQKLSALPTIDPYFPPAFDDLIDAYERLGLTSIYMRPVNYQGFARRRPTREDEVDVWNRLHSDFIEHLIRRNAQTCRWMDEFYFTHTLRRVLSSGLEQHVNIRNPNLLGTNYVLIDYDGTIYPTDEARMLARIGRIDLSIGHASTGIDTAKRDELNTVSMNNFDPDCIHCVYQPYCGTDIVDDLSRYGRLDIPRHSTWFCRRQMAVFDKVMELIYRDDAATKASLARWAGVARWPSGLARTHR